MTQPDGADDILVSTSYILGAIFLYFKLRQIIILSLLYIFCLDIIYLRFKYVQKIAIRTINQVYFKVVLLKISIAFDVPFAIISKLQKIVNFLNQQNIFKV